jgi:hypothetical protein
MLALQVNLGQHVAILPKRLNDFMRHLLSSLYKLHKQKQTKSVALSLQANYTD